MMKNRQKNILKGLAAIALSLSTQACDTFQRSIKTETSFQRFPVWARAENNIQGHELRRVTEEDEQYHLEGIIVNKTPYYVERNTNPEGGELDIVLVSKKDSKIHINRERRTVTVNSEDLYIPTPVYVPTGTSNVRAHTLPLVSTGDTGIKAIRTQTNTTANTGIFGETEEDARLNIRTIKIGRNGEEYYTPEVSQERYDEIAATILSGNPPETLSFYLIPVKGTTKIIDAEGRITLQSESGIYEPRLVTRSQYIKRVVEEDEQPIGQANTTPSP